MLNHGRLILTVNGAMLDEVKSLLQKALRRPDEEKDHILIATKELLGFGKDQLQWKSILIFLFEDHCLSPYTVLAKVWQLYEAKNKYGCIEILAQCNTDRISACLPVIAMTTEYDPVNWDSSVEVDKEMCQLVGTGKGDIDFDILLHHLKKAWVTQDCTGMVTYMKLASILQDHEKRIVTMKGEKYLISSLPPRSSPEVIHVVLSMLFKNTKKETMKLYLKYCYKLSTLKDAPHRLIMFAPVSMMMYEDEIEDKPKLSTGKIDWKTVPRLEKMPSWAVDKHTYRGKTGNGVGHLIKEKYKTEGMTEALFEEFYGVRPKVDIKHFFEKGCICTRPTVKNHLWEKTKDYYYNQETARQQKTVRMTVVYKKELLKKFPALMGKSDVCDSAIDCDEADERVTKSKKRKRKIEENAGDDSPKKKTRKLEKNREGQSDSVADGIAKAKKLKNQREKEMSSSRTKPKAGEKTKDKNDSSKNKEKKSKVMDEVKYNDLKMKGPLLQLPTGPQKVHTCLDTDSDKVWKGPYNDRKLGLVLFLHKAMKEVFEDKHTLNLEQSDKYVAFKLLKDPKSKYKVIMKDYTDCIFKKKVVGGQFIERDSLGIIQLHKLPAHKIRELPVSIWAHFLFRYCLNIGDSGLYNALTDSTGSFIYGIDMEEKRTKDPPDNILDYMFVKRPAKALVPEISRSIKRNKAALEEIVTKSFDFDKLEDLSMQFGNVYDRKMFERRLEKVKEVIKNIA